MSKLTLKKVIAIVKLSLFPTWCWPLPKDTVKLKVICAGIYQYFCIIVLSSVAAGLINAMRNHFDDPVIIAKSISVLCPAIQVVCNIMCCRINSYRLQVIIMSTFNCYVKVKNRQSLLLYTLSLCKFIYLRHMI